MIKQQLYLLPIQVTNANDHEFPYELRLSIPLSGVTKKGVTKKINAVVHARDVGAQFLTSEYTVTHRSIDSMSTPVVQYKITINSHAIFKSVDFPKNFFLDKEGDPLKSKRITFFVRGKDRCSY